MAYGADFRLFPTPTCELTAQDKWNLFALNIMANRLTNFGCLWVAVLKFNKSLAFFFGHLFLFHQMRVNIIIYFSISYTLMLSLDTLLATPSLASEREFECSCFNPSNLRIYDSVFLEANHLTFLIPNHKDVGGHLLKGKHKCIFTSSDFLINGKQLQKTGYTPLVQSILQHRHWTKRRCFAIPVKTTSFGLITVRMVARPVYILFPEAIITVKVFICIYTGWEAVICVPW